MLLIDKEFMKGKAVEIGKEVKKLIEKHYGNKPYKVEKNHCIVCNESVTSFVDTQRTNQIEIFICLKCISIELGHWYKYLFSPQMNPGDFTYEGKRVLISYHDNMCWYEDKYDDESYRHWIMECIKCEGNPVFHLEDFDYMVFAEKINDKKLIVLNQSSGFGIIKEIEENVLYPFSSRLVAVGVYNGNRTSDRKHFMPLEIADL